MDARVGGRRTGRVLVVDDQEANRFLLRELLEPEGHDVLEAVDGAAALELARTALPDIVLLDVMMPGVDGFEVCRRLKANDATLAIPVILLTALHERDERVAGIRAGADEFLTKPFDRTELVLRVRNAIVLHSLLLESQAQLRKLQDLEAMRDALVHLMVHDLRSPLTGVLANLELVRMSPLPDTDTAECVADALLATRQMADMVGDMLDVSRMETGQLPLVLERLELDTLIEEARRIVPARDVQVMHRRPDGNEPVVASVDRDIVLRVITNLIDNAVKFTQPRGLVVVEIARTDSRAIVSVTDQGPGIPPEAQAVIFDKFAQVRGVHQSRRSSGLGLAFCKLAVEAHGGEIGVESDGNNGSKFWFSVPAA